MSNMFKKPKMPDMPTPPAPTPAPTIDTARQAQQAGDNMARRRGRAATVLTGPTGDLVAPETATKRLLGG